ncbi:transposase-like protein [Conyzicola nivalis]|uniref:Transposase-like protein n=2 Tax=Conyzicola nivalis TaxID=1477021 RepID=A0ABV2QLW1_9MICO
MSRIVYMNECMAWFTPCQELFTLGLPLAVGECHCVVTLQPEIGGTMPYPEELKAELTARVLAGETVSEVSRQSKVPRSTIARWTSAAYDDIFDIERKPTAAERRRLEQETFDRDVDRVLARIGRDDVHARAAIRTRRRMANIARLAYTLTYVPLMWLMVALFWLMLFVVALVAVFGRFTEPIPPGQEILARVVPSVAVIVAYYLVKTTIDLLITALWELTGPFTLCFGALDNVQRHIRALPQHDAIFTRAWSSVPRSDRDTIVGTLRVVERQLSRHRLLYPGFATWGARGAQIRQRRRVASTVALIEVNLSNHGSAYYEEALQLLRSIEILTLLRDWNDRSLPVLEGAEERYRGWLQTIAALVWATLVFAIAAASLYFQVAVDVWGVFE